MGQTGTIYIGIDLGMERAMISFYHVGMADIETISTVLGEEKYQIPTAVYETDDGNIFYGEEAIRRKNMRGGQFYSHLYEQALSHPDSEKDMLLLVRYLRRLMQLRRKFDCDEMTPVLGIAVPYIDENVVALFSKVRTALELSEEQFLLMDYAESFYAHTYYQEESIWAHDVCLYDIQDQQIQFTVLHRGTSDNPNKVISQHLTWDIPAGSRDRAKKLDSFFADIIKTSFQKRIVSGIYFIGDGFDGNWMKASLRAVGKNKRVFKGKNLYTRGASYAAFLMVHEENRKFTYQCDYKIQGDIELHVQQKGKDVWIPLVTAGVNWFHSQQERYVIFNGDPVMEIAVKSPGSTQQVEQLHLDDIPARDSGSIRLAIRPVPVSGHEVTLQVCDDGFGDLYESTGKKWGFSVSF